MGRQRSKSMMETEGGPGISNDKWEKIQGNQQEMLFQRGEQAEVTPNLKMPPLFVFESEGSMRPSQSILCRGCLLSINRILHLSVPAPHRLGRQGSSVLDVDVFRVVGTTVTLSLVILRRGQVGGEHAASQSLLWRPIVTHCFILRPKSPLVCWVTLIKSPNLWVS